MNVIAFGYRYKSSYIFFQSFNHWNVKASLILNQAFTQGQQFIIHAREQSAGVWGSEQSVGLAGQAELSVGFVFGLAGITWLFAGVAPVVCLGARLVMPPR